MKRSSPLTTWPLMPGAHVVSIGERHAQIGVPPCIKLWFQNHLAPPTTFVLPDRLYHRGVMQIALEFFFYYFLFVGGKAFGRLPDDERFVVLGTASQIARCRRMLTTSLNGFSEDEMRSWRSGHHGEPCLSEEEIRYIRNAQLFLTPKRPQFETVQAFLDQQAKNGDGPARWRLPDDATPLLKQCWEALAQTPDPLSLDAARRTFYAVSALPLGDFIDWRAFDADGTAPLFDGATVTRRGGNVFDVQRGDERVTVDVSFDVDQAPWLVTLPPAAQTVSPEVLSVLCLGSDPGFDLEHPTTGFAICLNGSWAVIDAPVCASYLLRRHGIDPADVRVVFETHGHEDHMGSGIHFLLECMATGRSYTYVAAEPVYRTCLVKVAAALDITEEEADRLLSAHHVDTPGRGGVVRVTPGRPTRLLGATWHFYWMVHPVATTGFRIELNHDGRRHVLSYTSDTAPWHGDLGIESMRAHGFMAPDFDPYAPFMRGDEDLLFFEAGGTAGDPIHFNARDWDGMCIARDVRPTVVFMHVHPMPVDLRDRALARPDMVWTLIAQPTLPTAFVLKLAQAVRFFGIEDEPYWLWMFLSQGRAETYHAGATVLQGHTQDAWFIVLQGEAEVFDSGRSLGVLESTAFFGDAAAVDLQREGFEIRARSYLIVWRLAGEVLRDFVLSNGLWHMFGQLWRDVEWLGNSRLFLGFPHQVLASLAHRAQHRVCPAGEVLMRTGEKGVEMFVLVDGQVEVCIPDRLRHVCGPGEVLGEYSVLVPGARRSATVTALTDVRLLVLTRDILDEIVAGQIKLRLRLASVLAERGLSVTPLSSLTEDPPEPSPSSTDVLR